MPQTALVAALDTYNFIFRSLLKMKHCTAVAAELENMSDALMNLRIIFDKSNQVFLLVIVVN
jgi:hypothetical protein